MPAEQATKTRSGRVGGSRRSRTKVPEVAIVNSKEEADLVKEEEEEAIGLLPATEEGVKHPQSVQEAKRGRPRKSPRKPRATPARAARAKKGSGPDAAQLSGIGVKDGGVRKKAPARKKRVTLVTVCPASGMRNRLTGWETGGRTRLCLDVIVGRRTAEDGSLFRVWLQGDAQRISFNL